MADYYPLIARAVAGLEKNTGDARRALYERARTALVAQLRGVNPPLSENDVTRERLALEESIRKVEAETDRKNCVEPGNGVAPTRVRAPEFPRWDPPPASAPDDDEEPGPRPAPSRAETLNAWAASARSLRSPHGMLGARNAEAALDQPPPPESAPNGPRPAAARSSWQPDRCSLQDAGIKNFRNVV